jgi:heptosyltransferase I
MGSFTAGLTMRVLIVKTSSMGDVLHTLPAVQDAVLQLPGIKFNWVVEEAFQDIPRWHPAVQEVIPIALRRWCKDIPLAWSSREPQAFIRRLQETSYDLVIDAQGLFKSACITRLAKGFRVGFNYKTAREPIAALAYQKKLSISRDLHAINRLRQLFAEALGYQVPVGDLQYGTILQPSPLFEKQEPYLVFLHATTWESKHWPEVYWKELIRLAISAGFQVLLPWGTPREQMRAERFAHAGAKVLPKLTINEMAHLLQKARGCVAVDTGLGHVAAAVGTPTVSLYGPTNPGLTGAIGVSQQHLSVQKNCAPCFKRTCHFIDSPIMPPCFVTLPPEQVWGALHRLLGLKENQV